MPLSSIQPERYEELLSEKVATVTELFEGLSIPEPAIYPSVETGFRMRAEFRVWHEGADLNYVMFRPGQPKDPVVVTHFPIAYDAIQQMMPLLLGALKADPELRRKLFQVEFLSTLAGQALITLIYHRRLDELWEAQAVSLQDEFEINFPGLSIVGRSRKQKIILGRNWVEEKLCIAGETFSYRQYEQSFTQPNAQVNQHMIEWACDKAHALDGDLLELYCGNGNFTLPLSRHFSNVIATELSKVSVRAARENIEANSIDNIQIIRLSAEEVTQAMNRQREFRRLAELNKPLDEYDLRTVFVDPPRAGLDDKTVSMVSGFEQILYISCNPHTLVENLAVLDSTHRISHLAMFDQFPYTGHMECGVLLQRR